MNNELMFSSKSDEWETPQDFFDKIDAEFNFTLDVCATEFNTKCICWLSPKLDGLKSRWHASDDVFWCNPPYSQISKWVSKASEEKDKGAYGVMLIPARTDTRYFHKYIWDEEINHWRPGVQGRFIKGRLKFGDSKNAAPFPSMLVIFDGRK